MNHFTDRKGYNAIKARSPWLFLARKPPGDRPVGAYFTTLDPGTRNLAQRLRIPECKTEYLFSFVDRGDLLPLRGGRGEFVFYSPRDYEVEEARQRFAGYGGDVRGRR
jgi:hypothetical protein